jgi:hypothetical protein
MAAVKIESAVAEKGFIPYDAEKALTYAAEWALGRNPRWGDFEEMGGDCTNFLSQVLYAAGAPMRVGASGWYYHSMDARAPAWTGVPFFYEFLTTNKGKGPFAREKDIALLRLGDVVELKFAGKTDFSHNLLVTRLENPIGENDIHSIFVTAHSYDAQDRPLDSYSFEKVRGLYILGARQ